MTVMRRPDATITQTSYSTGAVRPGGSHLAELRNVSLWFGQKNVLENVSLAVDPQERLVIIGQSGAGKTTILRLILGILKPGGSSFANATLRG